MSRRKSRPPNGNTRCRVARIDDVVDRPRTWRELLLHYDAQHAENERAEVAWFAAQPSLESAIDKAAIAENPCGKRYDHQWRIRRTAVARARELLHASHAEIAAARSFSELVALVERVLLPIHGTGELYCYDFAARIGAYVGLHPDRVYLHRGTRAGARALKLPHTQPSLLISELPKQLRERSPRQVENILCIYADDFPYIT